MDYKHETLEYIDQITRERGQKVYKSTELVQKARYTLKPIEQKTLLYAISKIKPSDNIDTEYTFEIKDFLNICGLTNKNYTQLKKIIKELADKSWWMLDDKENEYVVRWLDTVRIEKGKGTIKLRFHREMMPFLIDLSAEETFITKYQLKYILPMSSAYSIRLYEILKSYSNRKNWFFDIDDIKRLLDCKHYKNYNDFKKRVLIPAIEEINKYTDIYVSHEEHRDGRKVYKISFYFDEKTNDEKWESHETLMEELDGQMYFEELLEKIENYTEKEREFNEEREKIHQKEKKNTKSRLLKDDE